MKLKLLHNEPVALWEEWLIISDLHIGSEKTGVNWRASAEIVRKLMVRERKKRLLILGDIKASVVSGEGDAGKFIREIGSEYDLHITKGNHDGNIEKYSGYCTVYGPEGTVVCKEGIGLEGRTALSSCIGVFHGHAWPAEKLLRCRLMLMGHAHPKMVFEREWKRAEKVWIFGKLNEGGLRKHYGSNVKINPHLKLVCVPAFGPFVGAHLHRQAARISPVKKMCCGRDSSPGPLLREGIFIKSSAEIYLLNGIQLK